MSGTHAILSVSRQTFEEIKAKLVAAGYTRASDARIRMDGLALEFIPDRERCVWTLSERGKATSPVCSECDAGPCAFKSEEPK